MQKTLKKKRTEFLLRLVKEFQDSDENQNLLECYDYVKTQAYLNIEDFNNTLSDGEKKIFEKRVDLWFNYVESLTTFQVFLNNYQITL